MRIKKINCDFKQHGDEEMVCQKCNYVIGGDISSLETMLNMGYITPNCGVTFHEDESETHINGLLCVIDEMRAGVEARADRDWET